VIYRLRRCIIVDEALSMGSIDDGYPCPQKHRGHDCPCKPSYQHSLGLWLCSGCGWSYDITAEDCHICGDPHDRPPNPLPETELFLSFVDPVTQRILSMHTSCAVQEYLSAILGRGDNSGGIP